ncbi:LLM class flavin-dependent oxidoreductase [Rhodococcus hoagii]|nr:LLM class flavin-dependent oxidoreductase [Prescottella equi]
MILAMALGAATSTLRFTDLRTQAPRPPAGAGRQQAASVAYLTGNRLRLGVGVSPWPDDFQIMDVPWERRGARTDEAIDIVRGLTGGGYFEYHGEIFDVPSIKINPVPTQPIPILIGGHSEAALRRAVVRGDGWTHAGGDPEGTRPDAGPAAEDPGRRGKSDTPFEIHVASAEAYGGRDQAPRRQRRHRCDRRLPQLLRRRPGRRTARAEDREPGELRGIGDRQRALTRQDRRLSPPGRRAARIDVDAPVLPETLPSALIGKAYL